MAVVGDPTSCGLGNIMSKEHSVISTTRVCLSSFVLACSGLLLCFEKPSLANSPERIKQKQTLVWSVPQPEDFSEYMYYLTQSLAGASEEDEVTQKADSLAKIRQLLKSPNLTKATKAALMLKVVHLYEAKSVMTRKEDAAQYGKVFDRWQIRGIFSKIPSPSPNYKASRQLVRKAIDAMRNLINQYPAFGNNPRQLLKMGSLQLATQNVNAELYLLKAMKLAPNSQWAVMAKLVLAQHYYYQGDAAKSLKLFQELVTVSNDGVWQYARYMLAWFGLSPKAKVPGSRAQIERAAKVWMQLLTNSKTKGVRPFRGSRAQKVLIGSIARDLVWAWSELGGVNRRKSFFVGAGRRDLYYDLLERYGWKLQLAAKIDEAMVVYNLIFKEAPDRFGLAKLYFRLIQQFFTRGDTNKLAQTFQAFARVVYQPSSPWNKAKFADEDHRDFVRSVLKRELLQKGKFYERRYAVMKDPAALTAINVLYHAYLQLFPKSPESYDIHMQYAQSYELLGRLGEAVFHYHEVVNYKVRNPSHRKAAAEKMISIQRKIIANEKFKP
ncbi:MAG: hypothetical protein OXT67_05270, partial [Zetaproteobacteria bacterium]|nr:hypothetical protein [Zetaproteobacteria bacterium]